MRIPIRLDTGELVGTVEAEREWMERGGIVSFLTQADGTTRRIDLSIAQWQDDGFRSKIFKVTLPEAFMAKGIRSFVEDEHFIYHLKRIAAGFKAPAEPKEGGRP